MDSIKKHDSFIPVIFGALGRLSPTNLKLKGKIHKVDMGLHNPENEQLRYAVLASNRNRAFRSKIIPRKRFHLFNEFRITVLLWKWPYPSSPDGLVSHYGSINTTSTIYSTQKSHILGAHAETKIIELFRNFVLHANATLAPFLVGYTLFNQRSISHFPDIHRGIWR